MTQFSQKRFYRNSFFALLLVSVSYSVLLTVTIAPYRFGYTELYASIWFVFFYWLPTWASAFVIFRLRDRAKKRASTLAAGWEVLIACVFMSLGAAVVDNLIAIISGTPRMQGWGAIFTGSTWALIIYFFCRFIEYKAHVAAEKKAREQAQLMTLRYQLNPHFMFNSLNTISAYIHSAPDQADEVLHKLADILRYSLDTAEQERVSVQQEMDMIDSYLAIEQARFGERLTVERRISEQAYEQPIPPLLLQPIVENAIKHCAGQTQLNICIEIDLHDNELFIRVADNGPGFPEQILKQNFGTGIGMKNLYQRVQQLPKGQLTLSNSPGADVTIKMAVS